jgi:ankyrin repeat protein
MFGKVIITALCTVSVTLPYLTFSMNTIISPLQLCFSVLASIAIALLPQISVASPNLPALKQSKQIKPLTAIENEILLKAVIAGNFTSAKLALLLGANPHTREKYGLTVLVIAAKNGHLDIAQLLLAHNADPNYYERGSCCHPTPLMVAAYNGDLEMVKLLLGKGAKVNTSPDEGVAAIDEAISQNHPDVVKLLLENGADPNHHVLGARPLHHAAYYGYPQIVSLLIDHGADINAKSISDNKTPLAIAIQHKHLDVVELLKKAGAK